MSLLDPGTPVILQTETAECAVACFCMIAGSHGYDIDLLTARQRFATSLRGATIADLLTMAGSIALQARALQLELDELGDLHLPAILHWELNHFVVLVRVTRRGYVVHDPATGKQVLTRSQMSDGFTGIAVECRRAPEFRRKTHPPRLALRALLQSVQGLPALVGGLFALSIVLQCLTLLLPFVFQLIVDDVLVSHDAALLLAVCGGIAFLGLFETAVTALRQWGIDVAGAQLSRLLTTGLMQHLLRLPLSYFEKRQVGDILTRMASMDALQTAMTTTLAGVLVDSVVVIGTATVMFFYSRLLGWLVLGTLALLLTIRLMLYGLQRRLQDTVLQQQANTQSYVIETLHAVHSVRAVNGEPQRLTGWSARFTAQLRAQLGLARFNLQAGSLESGLAALLHVAVIYIAAGNILQNPQAFTVGMLFAFLAYKNQFTERAQSLVEHLLSCRLLDLHLQRIADILLTDPEPVPALAEPGLTLQGDIRLNDVGFRYGPLDAWVMRHLSLTIPAGRMTAIIGPSGSGKTTLMKLLAGLYAPIEGDIRVGRLPIDRSRAQHWRSQLGIVLQEDLLISGTVADNIALLTGEMDLERVQQAATLAGVHDEICLLPMGYLSLVGELGSCLSSGQQQRLLIARALYRQPQVLLLDEGTAHLDAASEARLCEVLARLPITRIVIAHRPALVRCADQVLSLDGGRLIDVTAEWQTTLPRFERLDAV